MTRIHSKDAAIRRMRKICNGSEPWLSPNELEDLVQRYPKAIRVRDIADRLPLHCALEANCSVEVIQTLIRCWPKSLRIRMEGNLLPLHFACQLSAPQLTVIQALVQGWPNSIRERDRYGLMLPLHYACMYCASAEVVQFLIECWPESLQVGNMYGALPLHLACWGRPSLAVIYYVLDSFPQAVQMQDECLRHPLHYACMRASGSELELIKRLVQVWPESIRVPDQNGFLPLHEALRHDKDLEIIQTLVEFWPESVQVRSLSLKDRGYHGRGPLHLACLYQSSSVIHYVLNLYPQAVQIKDEYLTLPLHYALEREPALPLELIEQIVQAWPESSLVMVVHRS